MYCEDALTFCGDIPTICSLLNIGDGSCEPRARNNCTPSCQINICGDGFISSTEECDDGNMIDDDSCSNVCKIRYCGDGIFDENGGDNILFTNDDEVCDDGLDNGTNWSTCTQDCRLTTCGNGRLNIGEECDFAVKNARWAQCNDFCRLTFCGDHIRQRPNGL